MPKIHHHIRLAVPEDAEDIARIAMLSHGSILFHEDIYYPARVREMIQSKQMVSVVAVTDDNTLFGHGALVSPEPDSLVESRPTDLSTRNFEAWAPYLILSCF